MRRLILTISAVLCAALLLTGCSFPIGKKQEQQPAFTDDETFRVIIPPGDGSEIKTYTIDENGNLIVKNP